MKQKSLVISRCVVFQNDDRFEVPARNCLPAGSVSSFKNTPKASTGWLFGTFLHQPIIIIIH